MSFITAFPMGGGVLPIDAAMYTALEADTDLNDIITPGEYTAIKPIALTASNLPSSYLNDYAGNPAFILTVAHSYHNNTLDTDIAMQCLKRRDDGNVYWVRHQATSDGVIFWRSWYKYNGTAD